MSAGSATRFFDTTGCLNLSRGASGPRIPSAKHQRRPASSSGPIRGQIKIDLYNFDHVDFLDSKYVLTSPRSLEACARLDVKPATLLPRKLADITSDKVRYSTLVDVHEEMEIDRLAKLQRCREERENIIREQTLSKTTPAKVGHSKPAQVDDRSAPRQTHAPMRFIPSNSLLQGLHQSTTINTIPSRVQSATTAKFSQNDTHSHRPPKSTRQTVASSVLKPSVAPWPPSDHQNELRTSSSASFLDDVRRMDQSLQRIGTSKSNKNEQYVNGLENVKQIIEQYATQTIADNQLDSLTSERKQYDLLVSHYGHELKIQKARENARRTEKEKETERHDLLMHDFLDQTMAEERRQNELRRKLDKLHRSRQLYEALQAKNHELQMADVQKRRSELLNEIKRKDRRTQHFVKDKQDTVNLSRTLAKSSQDTREYLRETKETFDQKARKAELTTSILVTKANMPVGDRRHLQSTLQA